MKMAQMTISLPDELKQFAEKKGDGGEYSTSSDYIRSLIRADKERAWARLEKMLLDGLNSAKPIVNVEETMAELRKEAERRLAEHKVDKSVKK